MSVARAYLGSFPTVARVVFGNAELRRLELAFAGFSMAEWAVWIAMIVYAYGRGGATLAAVVAVVQLVPAAIFAPIGATLGDRYRAGRVLLASYATQAAAMGATGAVLLADGPSYAAYALAAIAATAVTVTRPTMSALTPSVARSADQLTATNAMSSWVESISTLAAPALAGVLLAVSEPGTIFVVMAAAVAASALLVLPVPGPPPAGTPETAERFVAALSGAFRVIRSVRAARLLVLLLCADFVAIGALDILYPELAIAELGLDASWAAYLNAAFGLGATLAVAVTAGLVGKRRLVPTMLAGLAVYALAFVVLAAVPLVVTAVVLLALAGAGRVVLDVAARTLLQRIVPPEMLARVFGLLEGISMAAIAVGSLLVAALVALGGAALALVGVGLLVLLAAASGGRALLGIDQAASVPVVEVGLLRALPLFSPLDPITLERLARSLVRIEAPAGVDVILAGEEGDRFYVIADGSVDVVRNGMHVATLRRGEGFGEIALLHRVTRTATCTTTAPTVLFALEKDDFLGAVSANLYTSAAAEDLVAARGAPEPTAP